jgi:hypothetical protein
MGDTLEPNGVAGRVRQLREALDAELEDARV